MLMPSILSDNLFDNWMETPFEREFFGRKSPMYSGRVDQMMRTDVREVEGGYELDMDLPGFKKEDIKAQLEDGYLTISASRNAANDQKDENGKYIRRERYAGTVSRSFYVGEYVTENDIRARFEDGILKLSIPKKEEKPVEEKKYVTIEG